MEQDSGTPGPWTIERTRGQVKIIPTTGRPTRGTGFIICHVGQNVTSQKLLERREANAALIVAAPTMLTALRNVQKLISEAAMTGFNCHDGDWAERLFASQQVTSDAIRQATGRYK